MNNWCFDGGIIICLCVDFILCFDDFAIAFKLVCLKLFSELFFMFDVSTMSGSDIRTRSNLSDPSIVASSIARTISKNALGIGKILGGNMGQMFKAMGKRLNITIAQRLCLGHV